MRRRPLLAPLALAALLTVVPALAGHAGAAPAAATAPEVPPPKAEIVADATSGRLLVCSNVHESLRPASTAKIMTALVAVERLPPNKLITVDAQAAQAPEQEVGFTPGQKLPLDKMLASLMMWSANDAAYTLAINTSGSLDAFAAAEAETGRRYGLKESSFSDPSGLDTAQSFKGGPRMSAYDLAIVTRNALSVPAIARWASTHEYRFTAPWGTQYDFVNHNRMLPGGTYAYPGATGFKTGFTNLAQHSIVATATRDGHTLIAVVLGSVIPGGYAPAAAALDAGFAIANGSAPADEACGKEVLPPNKVSLYAGRKADRDSFERLGAAKDTKVAAGAMAAATPLVPSSIPNLSELPHAARPVTRVVAHAPSGGLLTTRNAAIVLVLLLALGFALRRRAVRRKRAQREARRRQRAAAMRSGSLPVVDGRYRPGTRIGKPVESHVRIRRANRRPDARTRSG